MYLSTAIVIQNEGGRGYSLTEAPLPARSTTTSQLGRGRRVRARRPTGKRSASRERPRSTSTAQATSRGDFYPLHPFRPHHGRPSGFRGRGGRARLRQAGRAEAEERARSEEPQVHRSLLQATDLLQPLHRLYLVSIGGVLRCCCTYTAAKGTGDSLDARERKNTKAFEHSQTSAVVSTLNKDADGKDKRFAQRLQRNAASLQDI